MTHTTNEVPAPTLAQLQSAFNNACLAAAMNFPGGHAEKLVELRRLRNSKWTWVGTEENALRFEIDKYLREYSA